MNDSSNNKDSRLNTKQNRLIFGIIVRILLNGILFSVLLFALGLGLMRLWIGPYLEDTLINKTKLNNWLPSVMVEKNIEVEIDYAKIDWSQWLYPNLVLKRIKVSKDSKFKIMKINELESRVGLTNLISFFQKKTIESNVKIKEAVLFLNKYQSINETKLLLAGLPLLFTRNENEKNNFYYSPSELNIKKIILAPENSSIEDNSITGDENESVSLGSVKIQNEPNQLRVFFGRFTTKSLLSIASIMGKLPKDYLRFEGLINSLTFKFPRNYEERLQNKKELSELLTVEAKFENLGITKTETNKGFSGLGGSFLFDASGIDFTFFSNNVNLSLPHIFSESSVNFSKINGRVGLKSDSFKQILRGKYENLSVEIYQLDLSNADLSVKSNGFWNIESNGVEKADINGKIVVFKPEAISDYLPKRMTQKTRNWFDRGIKSADSVIGSFSYDGPATNLSVTSNRKKIKFVSNLKIENLDLLFSSKWPLINGINAEIEFKNQHFKILNANGFLDQSKLISVNGGITDIFSKNPELSLTGKISGPLQNFIYIANNSPIKNWLWGATKTATGNGQTDLNLSLNLNLKKIKTSKVIGSLIFKNTDIFFNENFLPMKNITGEVNFSEKSLLNVNCNGEILGGEVKLFSSHLSNFKKGIYLNASGIIEGTGLQGWVNENFGIPIQSKIIGSSEYDAKIKLFKGSMDIEMDSDLRGLLLDLPDPLYKAKKKSRKVNAKFSYQIPSVGEDWKRIWDVRLGNNLIFLVNRVQNTHKKSHEDLSIQKKFAVLIDEKESLDLAEKFSKEFSNVPFNKIIINYSHLDAKSWIDFLGEIKNYSQSSLLNILDKNPLKFELNTGELNFDKYNFTNFYVQTIATANSFSGIFKSSESTGVFNWIEKLNKLKVHLSHFHSNKHKYNDFYLGEELGKYVTFKDEENWPSINLFIDDFKSFDFQGKLALEANYLANQKLWEIERIEIFTEMTRFVASGFWNKLNIKNNIETTINDQVSIDTNTELDFRVETKNGANLLEDFGYSGLLAGSGGIISGQLKWLGSPLDARIKGINGDLSLDIQKGKFLKVEPGLARLIGVLNLQSLPRRIKLDFQDIFSEGFSFDKLRGNVILNNGTAHTENLRVVGTQASVFLEGEVGLLDQTQDMRILVLPELNAGLASLGYVLINPAIGLGSFLAQYILRDPLRKILAYEYKLKGSWDEPVVEAIPQQQSKKNDTSVFQKSLGEDQ